MAKVLIVEDTATLRAILRHPLVSLGGSGVWKAAEGEEPSSGGGLLGKLGKSLLKKKPNPEEEKAPAIAFYTEVTSLTAGSVEAEAFQPPADYKKK